MSRAETTVSTSAIHVEHDDADRAVASRGLLPIRQPDMNKIG